MCDIVTSEIYQTLMRQKALIYSFSFKTGVDHARGTV